MSLKKHAVVIGNPIPAHNLSPFVSLGKFLKLASEIYQGVDVLVAEAPDAKIAENVSFSRIKCPRTGSKIKRVLAFAGAEINYFFKALKLVKKDDDVYFWIGDKMLLPFFAAKLKGGKISFFLLISDPAQFKGNRLSTAAFSYMLRRSDYICVEGKSVLKNWGFAEKSIRNIHLFYEAADNECLKPADCINIGFLGRLSSEKHPLEVINSFSALSENSGVKLRLDILGDGPLLEECRRAVESSGARESIQLCGWVSHEEIFDYLKSWHFFILPSDTEGLPNSLLESMAFGVVPIASPAGAIPDVVTDGQNGIIIKSNDEVTIGSALNAAVKLENREQLSENAVTTVLESYSFSAALKQFINELGL